MCAGISGSLLNLVHLLHAGAGGGGREGGGEGPGVAPGRHLVVGREIVEVVQSGVPGQVPGLLLPPGGLSGGGEDQGAQQEDGEGGEDHGGEDCWDFWYYWGYH